EDPDKPDKPKKEHVTEETDPDRDPDRDRNRPASVPSDRKPERRPAENRPVPPPPPSEPADETGAAALDALFGAPGRDAARLRDEPLPDWRGWAAPPRASEDAAPVCALGLPAL